MPAETSDALCTLKEMLLDEKKLVTYISLSRDLCIHVNESKKLLSIVVEDFKKDKNLQLNVNYLISGLLENNKAQTLVCNESELSELRKTLMPVFFQHLYSVSVGVPAADKVSLMAVNKFEDFPLCKGLIKSEACVKRPAVELVNLRTKSQDIISNVRKADSVPQKKSQHEVKNDKGVTNANTKTKADHAKPALKCDVTSSTLSNSTLDKNDHKTYTAQKGIAGFFNKNAGACTQKTMNGTKTNNNKNAIESSSKIEVEVKTEKMEVEMQAEKMEVDQVVLQETPIQNEKQKENTPIEKSNKKSLKTIKKSATVDKKRKRVLLVSDSESEDEKNDPFKQEPVKMEPESDDEIPPTPANNTVKITSGIVNPRKKRKYVDKTYTVEEGYILTKKEEVYESGSEPEEDSDTKENVQNVVKEKVEVSPKEIKNGIKKNKKKINSPQKGKQTTISSFFKKI